MPRLLALMLLVALLAPGGAACGGDDDGDEGAGDTVVTETTDGTVTDDEMDAGETDDAEIGSGEAIFASAGCGSCHTFTPAGSTGTVGPNLDETALDADAAATQIRDGGGAMPPFEDRLSEDEIEELAEYVTGS